MPNIEVVGIDPGVNYCGVASIVVGNKKIKNISADVCGLDSSALAGWLGTVCAHIVIEKPEIYPGAHVDYNSIMDLMYAAGRLHGLFSGLSPYSTTNIINYKPRQWKGQVPKDIHQKRLLEKYPIIATAVKDIKKSDQEHAVDACGLALYHLEQIGEL